MPKWTAAGFVVLVVVLLGLVYFALALFAMAKTGSCYSALRPGMSHNEARVLLDGFSETYVPPRKFPWNTSYVPGWPNVRVYRYEHRLNPIFGSDDAIWVAYDTNGRVVWYLETD